jgi:pantoate--beta-alanine ligase
MQKIETIPAMREAAAGLRQAGRKIALVPTLGALHADGSAVVVSTFVNPLQFGASEDFTKYPRSASADLLLAEKEGADVLFSPTTEEMYPKGFSTTVQEETMSKLLCGVVRPTLFRGTLTCWLKLFNIVQPDTLILGERDAQQVAVVKKVVTDLHLPIRILTGPTVRDADGMAMSARNTYLSPTQREEALAVVKALRKAKEMVDSGVKSCDRLVAEATHIVGQKRRLRVVYISVVDRRTMEQLREVAPGECLMAISYWVDEVRMTDNMPL